LASILLRGCDCGDWATVRVFLSKLTSNKLKLFSLFLVIVVLLVLAIEVLLLGAMLVISNLTGFNISLVSKLLICTFLDSLVLKKKKKF
jgi:uncharacterized membrane-anchored protein YitT (DUF2179 family)